MRSWINTAGFLALVTALAALAGCGAKPATVGDLNTQEVTLPGGQVIHAEMAITDVEMLRGLMFRASLAPDHGMLFIHRNPGQYSYWMYQTLIPLDIIWMDSSHRVVEISADTPPCKTNASKCPQYGGHEPAKFVLEINGGLARKYGISRGDFISF